MPGRFIDSPDIIGKAYHEVADYPNDRPIAVDGNRCVYRGKRKVYLVKDGIVEDYFDWEIYGSQYRDVQKNAQYKWGIRWIIG
jgi:hypothetical protein